MAAVKQIKIGNTNYDLKALNAANQNQSNAVVRDVQYGTAAPSGGSAGQMYLQYTNTDTTNPYIYAEDTPGTETNVSDKYYSKSEVDDKFTGKKFGSHTGQSGGSINSIFNEAKEFYVVVSKYYGGSATSSNPVMQLSATVLKQQLLDDGASSYNTGQVCGVPTTVRYTHNGGINQTGSALFGFSGGPDPSVQLNELFCPQIATGNQAPSGYYVLYGR